jgi:hypothetical protein
LYFILNRCCLHMSHLGSRWRLWLRTGTFQHRVGHHVCNLRWRPYQVRIFVSVFFHH